MVLDIKYWYWEGVLSNSFIEHLKKFASQENREEHAIVGGTPNQDKPLDDEGLKTLHKKRNSDITWLGEKWIYDEIHPFVHAANRNANWNFEWSFSECAQYTNYRLNQHYDWHCDSWDKPYASHKNPNHVGKIRKLSTICSLTDPSEYDGGELEFQFRNNDDPTIIYPCTEIMKKGSVVVFPSFLWHRVKPITRGTRNSLVMWHLGQPFV